MGSEREGELDGKEAEGEAVVGGGAVGFDGGAVVGGGIAFVGCPAVGGILAMKPAHDFVTVGFGEYGGGGDIAKPSVALYECLPGDVAVWFEAIAVDDNGVGAQRQGVEGAVHGQDGGVEYVDAVDFLRRADAHAPCKSLGFDDGPERLATALGGLLGVVEPGMMEVRRKNHGGGHYRAGETSASGFVASGFEAGGTECIG